MKIIIDHLTHKYEKGTSHEVVAFEDVNIVIEEGQFVCLIGHTGCGKSTLIQHLNGILKPDSGTIYYNGEDIFEKEYDLRSLRQKVGLVFQYPEHQLFGETCFSDVCYGPLNMGLSKKEAELRSYEVMKLVGIDDEIFYQSPFNLSGGQKRKVAIAGILAMRPEVLILDEPTAGLDPLGQKEIFNLIKKIQKETNLTIILVSHSMEDVANYADKIVVMNHGHVLYNDEPKKVFAHYDELEKIGLKAPFASYLMADLSKKGFDVDTNITTNEEAVSEILHALGR